MRVARVRGADGVAVLARVEGDLVVPIAESPDRPGADPLRDLLADGADLARRPAIADSVPLDEVRLLAPVVAPEKVVCIGLNYRDHARETGIELPKAPLVLAKFPSSIIGPHEPIRFQGVDTAQVDYEAELAVVIGRTAKDVAEAHALEYVAGYTACDDVTARDAQFGDGQWVRGKSFDSFCPLGPWLVTADEIADPQALAIRCRVNGETLQDSDTGQMVFGVAAVVAYVSRFVTLRPGDVIATGTPAGVGFTRTPPRFLADGDVVEVDIEGIGVLRNPVVCT